MFDAAQRLHNQLLACLSMPKRPSQPVLVVEDHPDVREMVELCLQMDGFAVCSACDGVEALECLVANRPCLILLDVNMPRMDGITFGRRVRHHPDPEIAHTPIILLTAVMDPDGAGQAVQAAQVITKPMLIDEVVRAVEQHCSSGHPGLP